MTESLVKKRNFFLCGAYHTVLSMKACRGYRNEEEKRKYGGYPSKHHSCRDCEQAQRLEDGRDTLFAFGEVSTTISPGALEKLTPPEPADRNTAMSILEHTEEKEAPEQESASTETPEAPDLSPREAQVLIFLREKGPISYTEIATGTEMTKTNVGNVINRLKKKGLANNPVKGQWVAIGSEGEEFLQVGPSTPATSENVRNRLSPSPPPAVKILQEQASLAPAVAPENANGPGDVVGNLLAAQREMAETFLFDHIRLYGDPAAKELLAIVEQNREMIHE